MFLPLEQALLLLPELINFNYNYLILKLSFIQNTCCIATGILIWYQVNWDNDLPFIFHRWVQQIHIQQMTEPHS